jgi:5,10-methylenetetrahydromethanopterin reductase
MAIATLDEISRGRAILGIGAGIWGFAELGIDRKKPARAIREAIELIRGLNIEKDQGPFSEGRRGR